MPKTKSQKDQLISDLVDKMSHYKSLIFADYKGLTVVEAQEIRKLCRKQGAEYLVVKKTLIKLALEKAGIKDVDVKSMSGNIAVLIGFEDEIVPAKIAATFALKHKNLKMLGGLLENKFIDLDKVQSLALIPSKTELLAKLVGTINAPVSGFVNVLAANIRALLYVVTAIKEQKS